ncbi:MAG: ROK family protein [Cellulomonas sp.]
MTAVPADAIAVDLGGTSVRIARVGVDGHLLGDAVRRAVGRTTTRADVVEIVVDACRELAVPHPDHVAVAIPSFVLDDQTMAECPSIPALTGSDLGGLLSDATGAGRVHIFPDIACAALAEQRLGTGVGSSRFVCVALGTGANAGAVVNGMPVATAFGCLGDAGHVLVDPDGPACPCGGRGCLESITSGWALARDGAALGLATAAEVTRAAQAGDVRATRLLTRAGVMLGRACATWSAMIWPDTIAVAGGLSGAGELLLAPARAEMHRVGAPYIVDGIRLMTATLGDEATLVGAGLLTT